MQQEFFKTCGIFRLIQTIIHRSFTLSTLVILLVSLVGCSGPPTVFAPPPPKLQQNIALSISCSDRTFAVELEAWTKAWANRNGARISIVDAENADIRILKAHEWMALAQADKLLPVPTAFFSETGTYQWSSLVPVYQTTLSRWGTQTYAVPLVGEGYAFIIRTDLLGEAKFAEGFRAKYGREASNIRTWEDLAEVAEQYTAHTNQSALAPVAGDVQKAFIGFSQLAACYDRAPTGGGKIEEGGTDLYRRGLSFYIDNELGTTRFNAPAFYEAINWYARTASSRAKTGEPIDCLINGSAVAAILPLSDLVSLPKDGQGFIESRYSLAPLPGTRKFFDAKGQAVPVATPNYIPYLGGAGLIGVVSASTANADTCWQLLAELGGPGGSEGFLNEPTLGAGPMRKSHLLQDVKAWRKYRFDEARTATLVNGLQQFQAVGTLNPALALRTPDEPDVARIIVEQLRQTATGKVTPSEAYQAAMKQWGELDQKTPAEILKLWRKRAAGLN
jgi:ABC-type glycerol-3-phosphate transport system substrate-binding protein